MEYELIIIGLLVSLLFISVTGYYPGGIIVPGYLVIFVDQPLRILGTLLVSLVILMIYRLVSNYTILFGKRKFVIMILLGVLLSGLLWYILPFMFPESAEFRVIGWVMPGLIANNFERQGIIVTSSAMAVVIAATFFIGKLLLLIFW